MTETSETRIAKRKEIVVNIMSTDCRVKSRVQKKKGDHSGRYKLHHSFSYVDEFQDLQHNMPSLCAWRSVLLAGSRGIEFTHPPGPEAMSEVPIVNQVLPKA